MTHVAIARRTRGKGLRSKAAKARKAKLGGWKRPARDARTAAP